MKALDVVAAGLGGRDFTLINCCTVLMQHHQRGDKFTPEEAVAKKGYKDDVDTLKFVFREMELDLYIPIHLAPAYRYAPADRELLDDAVLCRRLKQIKNKEDQKLLYAVIVYGKRNSEIYSMDWENLKADHTNQLVPTYSPKNGKPGITWQIPFGDEQISLKGFRPPEYDSLKCLSGERKEETKKAVTRISNKISALCRDNLGCEPTDLRHHWACKSLIKNNVHTVSSAMGTSVGMLEKTYSREISAYKLSNWTPNV